MYKIIVASHGPMAQGMKESLEFVMGPAENVSALCLDEEGISKFTENAKKLLEQFGAVGVIIDNNGNMLISDGLYDSVGDISEKYNASVL